jgi:uncharacterized protein (DUF58 family)
MNALSVPLPNELRRIQLRSRRLVTGDLLGQYRSAFRGSGLVFSDLREYQPGDEVKQIHWKATARTGTVYVKSYEEDRQLRVLLAVDTSASMRAAVGSTPFSKALEFCSLIGSLTQRGNDLLGVLTFSNQPGTFLPPKAGPKRCSTILSTLLNTPASDSTSTNLGEAADYLSRNLRRASILFILSDFECADFQEPLSKACARHDVVLVQIQQPEESIASAGLVTFRDAESGQFCTVDTSSKAVQRAWSECLRKRRERVSAIAKQSGADHIVIRSSCAQPLMTLMRERMRRVSR